MNETKRPTVEAIEAALSAYQPIANEETGEFSDDTKTLSEYGLESQAAQERDHQPGCRNWRTRQVGMLCDILLGRLARPRRYGRSRTAEADDGVNPA
jgi:hypothetical protein